jgi:hypothetical protein
MICVGGTPGAFPLLLLLLSLLLCSTVRLPWLEKSAAEGRGGPRAGALKPSPVPDDVRPLAATEGGDDREYMMATLKVREFSWMALYSGGCRQHDTISPL